MNKDETAEFFALLDQACEAMGKPAKSVAAKQVFLAILGGYGIKNLRGAVYAHLSDPERGRFVPTPADIKAQIEIAMQKDGRPTSDEAWSIAVQLDDERATVVSNDEIAQAWAVAREVMPDRVGARMAFRSAYERLVSEARSVARPVKWFPSMGADLQGREGPLLEAVRKGLLIENHVRPLLPSPVDDSAIKRLENHAPNPAAKQTLAKLRALTGIKS
jgi:hypothetical protein